MLRRRGVVGKFVEFYGEGLASLSLADRATIANMAPEYGATCGIFPVDAETLRYLRFSGRPEELVRAGRSLHQRAGTLSHGWHTRGQVLRPFGIGPGQRGTLPGRSQTAAGPSGAWPGQGILRGCIADFLSKAKPKHAPSPQLCSPAAGEKTAGVNPAARILPVSPAEGEEQGGGDSGG